MPMSEILLTEQAKHYLLSGHSLGETITVTVSPSEVNVIIRFSGPGHPVESNVLAQATTVDGHNYSVLLKQVQHVEEASGITDDKELAKTFISNLSGYIQLVETRRVTDGEPLSQPLHFLNHSLRDLLEQLQ